jgi:hypothetical protein
VARRVRVGPEVRRSAQPGHGRGVARLEVGADLARERRVAGPDAGSGRARGGL